MEVKLHLVALHAIKGEVELAIEGYKKILEYKPDVIVGFDPFFGVDNHRDHLALGRNYYFALKSLKEKERPRLMLYAQSFKNDFYVGLGSFKRLKRAMNCYKSQVAPFGSLMMRFGLRVLYYARSPLSKGRPCAGFVFPRCPDE